MLQSNNLRSRLVVVAAAWFGIHVAAAADAADPQLVNDYIQAAAHGSVAEVEAILQKLGREQVDAENSVRQTALSEAVMYNPDPAVALMLLRNGASPFKQGTGYHLPLTVAVQRGWAGVVRELARRGAITAAEDHGAQALENSATPEMKQLLVSLGAIDVQVLRAYIAAAKQGTPRQVEELLLKPGRERVDTRDIQGFVFSGSSPGEGARLYQQGIEGDAPRRLTEADIDLFGPVVSPDGAKIAATDAYGEVVLAPLLAGDVRPLPGVEEDEIPIQWRADGRAVYVYRPDRLPVEIFEVDVVSAKRRRVREIVLPDITGVDSSVVVALTPDARSYAYSFYRHLDELCLFEGLD